MWIQCNSCQSRYMFWWQVKVCILISASGLFLPIGHNFTPTWISTFCMCIMVYVAHYVWWISQNSTDGHTKRAAVTLCAGPPGQWFNPQQPHLSLTSAFLCSSVSTRQLCWPSSHICSWPVPSCAHQPQQWVPDNFHNFLQILAAFWDRMQQVTLMSLFVSQQIILIAQGFLHKRSSLFPQGRTHSADPFSGWRPWHLCINSIALARVPANTV